MADVKFLCIHSRIFIQIFIYFTYLFKSYYMPVAVLDSGDIAGRMDNISARTELTIYVKTAFYRVEVMRYSGDKGVREDGK